MIRFSGPKYLFHWTNAAALKAFAEGMTADSGFALVKKIPRDASLSRVYPQLRELPALFAWSHPVGGMASHSRLIYGGASPQDARLIVLEMKEDLSILRLTTREPCDRRMLPRAKLKRCDVIFHEIQYESGARVREWVVMNPAAVVNFTAAPHIIRAFLSGEASRLRRSAYDYPEAAFHYRSAAMTLARDRFFISLTSVPRIRRSIILPRLRAVLRLTPRRIPPLLCRPLSAGARLEECIARVAGSERGKSPHIRR